MRNRENNLNDRINDYIKRMCDTNNIEELNISFERAGNILSELFDKNYDRIKMNK